MTYSDREVRRIIRKIKKYQKGIGRAIRENDEYKVNTREV